MRFVQRVVLNILLTGLYLFGFGPSAVAARLFRLDVVRRDGERASFWLPTAGYDADLTSSREQS